MPFRLLKSYDFPHEAYLDLAKLRDENIDAFLKNEHIVTVAPHYSNAVGGVLLLVSEVQWESAEKLLDLQNDSRILLDDLFPGSSSEETTICPKCASANIIQGRSFISGLLIWLISALPLSIRKNRFHCLGCDYSWSQKF